MKNKIFKKLFAAVFVFCLLPGLAVAAESGDVSVPSGQEIATDYINAGKTVDVASDVKGDVILAGSNVSFSGNASGDVLMAAGNARVKGDSAGDVRIIGGNVTLDGDVAKNVTVIGASVIIEEGSVVHGNLYVAGGNVELRGEVKGNASVYGSQLVFSGKVGGNADFRSGGIVVRPDASVAGNLTYASSADVSLGQGVVKGSVTKVPMENYAANYTRSKDAEASGIGVVIWQFLSLLIVMLVLSKFFARQVKALTVPITKEEVWNRIASGFIWFVLNPIIIFITFITLIGMPLALMLLFVYVVLIICALAITPVLIGRLSNAKLKLYGADDKDLWKDFILGYVVMQIVAIVPVLGGLAILLVFLFAFGRVTKYISTAFKENQ